MHSFLLVDKASVSDARQQVKSELNRAGVDPSELFDCLLAMTEACNNALIHGTEENAPPAELRWSFSGASILFAIKDHSSQLWEPPNYRPPNLDAIEDLQPGGLGLEIMRDLMDEVRIDSTNTGTEVVMTRRISHVPASA